MALCEFDRKGDAPMRKLFLLIAVVCVTTTVATAQYGDLMRSGDLRPPSTEQPEVTLTGYLVDKTCALTHKSALDAMAVSHTTPCALEHMMGGLGIVSDGLWVPFDEKGSKKAADLLKKSRTDRGVKVQV